LSLPISRCCCGAGRASKYGCGTAVAQGSFAAAQESRDGVFSHDSGLQYFKVSGGSFSLSFYLHRHFELLLTRSFHLHLHICARICQW